MDEFSEFMAKALMCQKVAELSKKQSKSEKVNPSHYKVHEHECIDEMIEVFGEDAVRIYCTLNVWKYRYRAGYKTGESAAEDNAKSDWYINKIKELNAAEAEEEKKNERIGLIRGDNEVHSEVIYAEG